MIDGYSLCRVCPRACGVDRRADVHGVCGVGEQMLVARVGLHYWEEPPISGEAGRGTVFFAGCSLKCVYCQNAAISRGAHGTAMSVEELAQACLDLQARGALNVNLVTPTHYAPSARMAVSIARQRGLSLPVVWNTSGYETVETIRANASCVDVYLTDMKYADAALARALSGAQDYPQVALRALDAMVEHAGAPTWDTFRGADRMTGGVIVRHMVIPGHADDSMEVVRSLHDRYGNHILLSIMNQYTPTIVGAAERGDDAARSCLERFPELGRTVDDGEYEAVLDFADSIGVKDYFWQQGGTASESFIPDFEG